jgi:hypothetical protein
LQSSEDEEAKIEDEVPSDVDEYNTRNHGEEEVVF